MSSKYSPRLAAVLVLTTSAAPALSAGFAAGISPSKFELRAMPGDIVRDSITIVNPGNDPADYQFKTADWTLSETGRVEFVENTLVDGSCRTWVRLERRTLRVDAGAQRNYRFEVHVPANAPSGLCRFAILIEPADSVTARVGGADSSIAVPMVGRYAIVTYVTIGDASAAIDLIGVGTTDSNGRRYPAVTLRNSGNSYDRAFGRLVAVDFDGERVALVPSNFPILPGRTETIAMFPDVETDGPTPASLRFPLRMSGSIEIGEQIFEIDEVLE